MGDPPAASLWEHFSALEDPPSDLGRRHLLLEIIAIPLCAAICGAYDWIEVELFGQSKEQWPGWSLALRHRIPSHDTCGRVFRLLDPEQFARSICSWIEAVQWLAEGQLVAVDGKGLHRSHDHILGKAAIKVISARATANRLMLRETKGTEGSDEIMAVPTLFQILTIEGCFVTVDALGCQKTIAKTIVERGADYLLALKGNQGQLHTVVQDLFEHAEQAQFRRVAHDYHRTVSKGHGRIETRQCWTIAEADFLEYVREFADWPQLNTIVKVHAERRKGEEVTHRTRYCISSLGNDAQQVLSAACGHWCAEIQLHWVLEVVSPEDHSRIRKGNGAQHFAILRRLILSLLQLERTTSVGVKPKGLKTALDEGYLLKILSA